MTRISFLDCPHTNVQQFTECCMDCGYNIYTSEKQYLEELRKEVHGKKSAFMKEIRELEAELGIKSGKK